MPCWSQKPMKDTWKRWWNDDTLAKVAESWRKPKLPKLQDSTFTLNSMEQIDKDMCFHYIYIMYIDILHITYYTNIRIHEQIHSSKLHDHQISNGEIWIGSRHVEHAKFIKAPTCETRNSEVYAQTIHTFPSPHRRNAENDWQKIKLIK